MKSSAALTSGSAIAVEMRRLVLPVIRSLVVACLGTAPGTAGAGDLRAKVIDQDGRPVEDAVVAAKPVTGAAVIPVKPKDETVDQIDKEFVPYVKPIFVGSRVHFPNHDSVRHEVYSFSPAKKFQLPLYAGREAPPVIFDKPGIVTLGCNIHDWMIAYIYVSDTALSEKTAKEGTALLKDLPPGNYDVRVWHPTMSEAESATAKRVTLGKSGLSEIEWRITLKPAFKIRRAPAAGRGGYR